MKILLCTLIKAGRLVWIVIIWMILGIKGIQE